MPNETDGQSADGLLVGAPDNDSSADDAGAAYLVRSLEGEGAVTRGNRDATDR
ncbi:MAG: hypothetical protein U5K37_03795 [Natrialbaceae archaeon]|nr:hypothetical protein [Natrialbaceae archaeon]